MKQLGVTLDEIAVLREYRKAREPDPVLAAFVAEQAGASAINVHLRSDRRHIQNRDVTLLRETVTTELNLVGAPSQDMARFVLTVKPDRITFVPERLDDTSIGSAIDVILNGSQLRQLVEMMREGSIASCMYIDPELDQVKAAHQIDAASVDLSAEAFINARGPEAVKKELQRLSDASKLATKFGLHVSISHGPTLRNCALLAEVPGLQRLNVGHSLIARAMVVGLDRAVRQWLERLRHLGGSGPN